MNAHEGLHFKWFVSENGLFAHRGVESRVAWLTPGLGRTQPQRSEDGLGRARMSATLQPPHDQVPPTLQGVRVPGGATRWNSPVTFSLNIFPQSSVANCKVTFRPNICACSSGFLHCSHGNVGYPWLEVMIRSLQPRFLGVSVPGSGDKVFAARVWLEIRPVLSGRTPSKRGRE